MLATFIYWLYGTVIALDNDYVSQSRKYNCKQGEGDQLSTKIYSIFSSGT